MRAASEPYDTVRWSAADKLCAQGELSELSCNERLVLLAGATEGFRDAIGTESRFYHPTGLVASHRSQALYIADSHNHLIRVMNLTDRNVVEQLATDEWDEAIKNALWQNLAFILILVGGLLSGALFLYLSCRFCFVCPLYRKRLDEKRHREMNVGQRM